MSKEINRTVQFDLNQLRELLAILNQTDIAELTLKSSDFELTIRKNQRSESPATITTTPPAAFGSPPDVVAAPEPLLNPNEKKWVEVISPMVGTFYRSPAPDEPAFVEVNDAIRRGQTVCIIEAMKLMNEIEAEVGGQIMEILVQNGEPVEYGQALMRVNPS